MGSRSIGGTAPTTPCGLIENEWMKLDVRAGLQLSLDPIIVVLSAFHMQSELVICVQAPSISVPSCSLLVPH